MNTDKNNKSETESVAVSVSVSDRSLNVTSILARSNEYFTYANQSYSWAYRAIKTYKLKYQKQNLIPHSECLHDYEYE